MVDFRTAVILDYIDYRARFGRLITWGLCWFILARNAHPRSRSQWEFTTINRPKIEADCGA